MRRALWLSRVPPIALLGLIRLRWGKSLSLIKSAEIWFVRASLQRQLGSRRASLRLARIAVSLASSRYATSRALRDIARQVAIPLDDAAKSLIPLRKAAQTLLDEQHVMGGPQSWDLLARSAALSGDPETALQLRHRACSMIDDWAPALEASLPRIKLSLRRAFERGDEHAVERLITGLPAPSAPESDRELFGQLHTMIRARNQQRTHHTDHASTVDCDLLADVVRERSVALVAPGLIDEPLGDLIDDLDVVVRLQPYTDPTRDDHVSRGVRMDVAYFSSSLKILLEDGQPTESYAHLDNVQLIVGKRAPLGRQFRGVPVRSGPIWRPILFTTPISGTLALMDLLMGGASKVHVFGMNLYADPRGYLTSINAIYSDSKHPLGFSESRPFMEPNRIPSESLARSFMSHDLFSEFYFLQRLVRSTGHVVAHGFLKELLASTAEEYAKRLARNLRHH